MTVKSIRFGSGRQCATFAKRQSSLRLRHNCFPCPSVQSLSRCEKLVLQASEREGGMNSVRSAEGEAEAARLTSP